MDSDEDGNIADGSKRHSLQPIYRFLGMPAMRTRWMAGAVAHKSG